jgi:MFS family permease
MGTVLPVFLADLGANNSVIALLPALSALGMGLPQIFSGFVTRRARGLKGWVLWMHVMTPLPLALVAAGLWLRWPAPIFLVLAGWGLFYGLIGLVIPLWLDYMGRILDPGSRGRAFGIIFLLQTVAGALGVTAASALLIESTGVATYALLFSIAWATFTGGSFLFTGTREVEDPPSENPPPTLRGHFSELFGLWRGAPWMRAYLWTRWIVRAAYPLILNFYAVYAVVSKGASAAEAALFGAAGLLGQALAGMAAGLLGDRLGHKVAVLLGHGCLLAASLLVLLPLPRGAFYAVAVLSGAFLATEYTSQTNWVMDLAGPERRRGVLAFVGFLLTPAAVLGPLAGGVVMDWTGFRTVAAGVSALILLAMAIECRMLPAREGARPSDCLRKAQ